MPRVTISGRGILSLNIACDRTLPWIVPGALSIDFTLIQISLESSLKALQRQIVSLQDLHADMVEGPDGKKIKQLKPLFNEKQEQIGETITMKNQQLFDEKYNELLDQDFVVDIPLFITPDHFRRMKEDMVDDTRGLIPPAAAAFAPVMQGYARLAIAPGTPDAAPQQIVGTIGGKKKR